MLPNINNYLKFLKNMGSINIDDDILERWQKYYDKQDKVEYPSLKNFTMKILIELLEKENKKAIRSAISATINKDFVSKRNNLFVTNIPLILNENFENIKKAKELEALFEKMGLNAAVERSKQKQIRSGRGKLRSRKYRKKTGFLIVTSKKCDLFKAAKNFPGLDICTVDSLNVKLLAPGSYPGRFTIWSKSAIDRLSKEKLFIHSLEVIKKMRSSNISSSGSE